MKKLILFFLLFNFNHLKAESELFHLLKFGYLEPIEKLIKDKSFKPHERSEREKESFLHRSVEFASKRLDQGEITDLLIRKGVFVNAKDKKGNSPLHLASMYNQEKELNTLIYHGAYVNAQNQYGNTPLHFLAKDASRIGEILIRNGAYMDAQNQWGKTPLFFQIQNSLKNTIFLIKKGADFNKRDNDGRTIFHEAARYGRVEIIKHLIEKGVDPNVKDKHGETPVMEAVRWAQASSIETLTKHGALLTYKNVSGQNAFDLALKLESSKRDSIINLLKKHQRRPQIQLGHLIRSLFKPKNPVKK